MVPPTNVRRSDSIRTMTIADLDTAAIARVIARLVERPEDAADVYLEQTETVTLPADGGAPGLRARHEQGLAVRMERGTSSWLASTDRIDGEALTEATRRVARAQPRAAGPPPALATAPQTLADHEDVLSFPTRVTRAVRARQRSIPLRLEVARHRRMVQVVGTRLVSPVEQESFASVVAEMPGAGGGSIRWGALFDRLDESAVEAVARTVVRYWRCRDASPPEPNRGPAVLGPDATAVLLHETVAHALEADTLALGGHPEAALGVPLAHAGVHVLDDPNSAPPSLRRTVDDEGVPTLRRWLIRDGKVEQPLCDRIWAAASERLAAGAGRRGSRHQAPVPRSHHLELLPGDIGEQSLLADAEGGLYLPSASRGSLDPYSGRFKLHLPHALRIQNHVAETPVGPCVLHGTVSGVLDRITGIGAEVHAAGAGWCAKGGVRLPVWATVPAIRVEGVEITP